MVLSFRVWKQCATGRFGGFGKLLLSEGFTGKPSTRRLRKPKQKTGRPAGIFAMISTSLGALSRSYATFLSFLLHLRTGQGYSTGVLFEDVFGRGGGCWLVGVARRLGCEGKAAISSGHCGPDVTSQILLGMNGNFPER
jgi:hypothetical protein